jgi:hypothetical protein
MSYAQDYKVTKLSIPFSSNFGIADIAKIERQKSSGGRRSCCLRSIHIMPLDAGLGIAAAVAFSSKFVERSKFSSRHDAIYDKELEKSSKAAERFQNVPKEDVDFFEAEEYNLLHSKCVDIVCL